MNKYEVILYWSDAVPAPKGRRLIFA